MAERFTKVNEQEIRDFLDNTASKIPCLFIYNKTVIPFALTRLVGSEPRVAEQGARGDIAPPPPPTPIFLGLMLKK